MNQTNLPARPADGPWPTGDHRAHMPDTTPLPGSEKPATAAVGLLNQAVQGAHDGIERFADNAAPAVQQVGESLAAAEEALATQGDRLLKTQQAWAEGVRTTVRRHPLAAIAAALALGAVFGRVGRAGR